MHRQLTSLLEDLMRLVRSGKDPLDFEIGGKLRMLSELIDKTENFYQLELDTEALYRLALLIYNQSKSLKEKSSILYVDPFLIKLAIMGASADRLSDAYLRAWRPIASRDVLNYQMMKESFIYWSGLKKYELEGSEGQAKVVADLKSLGLLYEELLVEEIKKMHQELLARGGKLLYEELIGEGPLGDRLRRAVLISFMLSYGYATILKDPLRMKVWVIARERPEESLSGEKETLVMVVK